MSIKGFHLFFIGIAALFCAAFGVWALFLNDREGEILVRFIGGLTLLIAFGLPAYGVHFYRKAKNLS
ncbi:MAG: hypothetical protein ACQKBY_11910 [Verrucomicrobiales bacterium]